MDEAVKNYPESKENYTIIVADDEEELRHALIEKVNWESVGFKVIGEAENGVEALDLVEQLPVKSEFLKETILYLIHREK